MIPRTEDQITKSNEEALAAFVQKKAEIDAMLARLQSAQRRPLQLQPRRDHLGPCRHPRHYAELLKRVTDSAFNEGEHAG